MKNLFFWTQNMGAFLPLRSALTKIFGIGKPTSKFTVSRFGLSRSHKLITMSHRSRSLVVRLLRSKLVVLRTLHKVKSSRLAEMSKYGSKKSRRRSMGLPVNGQRTRSNARTIRRLLRFRKKVVY